MGKNGQRVGLKNQITVRRLSAEEMKQLKIPIAELRIKIFRDFPYIYDGSIEYEVKYLQRYYRSKSAAIFVAFDCFDRVIGMASCLPLFEEDNFVQKPFLDRGIDLKKYFYFGESLLLPEYRGQGVGHLFFDQREQWALQFPDTQFTTFCAVEREQDHFLKPQNYMPLDVFWKKRGYEKTDFETSFSWQDLGQDHETDKKMVYWIKQWNQN